MGRKYGSIVTNFCSISFDSKTGFLPSKNLFLPLKWVGSYDPSFFVLVNY